MADLASFLIARIEEDEALARAANKPEPDSLSTLTLTLFDMGDWQGLDPAATNHAYQWHPARVLAEREAKRRIIAEHAGNADDRQIGEPECKVCEDGLDGSDSAGAWIVYQLLPCPTLRALALPYASHPDYQDTWRP